MKGACPCKWSPSGGMSSEDPAALPSHTSQALTRCHPTLNQNPAELPLQGTGRLGQGVYNQAIPPLSLLGRMTHQAANNGGRGWKKNSENKILFYAKAS